ncbi:MAG: FAD binding domain-containing protein, partial [Edaphobacter sp.]
GGTDSEQCIATNPSDMNVAMAALSATVHVQGPKGKRTIDFHDFHLLPGNTPHIETSLKPDELITSVELPPSKFSRNSYYLKVRDRQSYAFALVSVAAGLELAGGTIKSAGLALGGVAPKPWRSLEAERVLIGATPGPEVFKKAADLAVAGAKPQQHNAFKIELAKQSIVRALTLAAQQKTEGARA